MKCQICHSNKINVLNLNTETFTHHKFSIIKSKKYILNYCQSCSLIFNKKNIEKKIIQTFNDKDYIQNTQVSNFKNNLSNKMNNKIDFICNYIDNKKINKILDIGCFNGELIKKLSKKIRYEKILGIDILKKLPKSIISENIFFSKKKLNQINEKFNIIILSHSIMYFNDLDYLFNNLHKISSNKTLFIVFIPDIKKRPLHLLLSDQCFYFDDYSFRNTLNKFNFKIIPQKNKKKTNEKIYVFKKNNKFNLLNKYQKSSFNYYFEHILNYKTKINKFKKYKQIYIFGTTIEAAYLSLILKNKVKYFVDEDVSKIGKIFHGKFVISPNQLSNNQNILINTNQKNLYKRLKNTYKGNFILI